MSKQQIDDAVSPYELTSILNKGNIEYILIEGHVLCYFTGSPKATIDVDVIVSNTHMSRAVRAIKAEFPQYDFEDMVYNVRFCSKKKESSVDSERIDVIRSNNPFFQKILKKYTVPIISKGQKVNVPAVEAAIALKFAAAISPNRSDEDRPQDRTDLTTIIKKHQNIKQEVLSELGDLIYPGRYRSLQRKKVLQQCMLFFDANKVQVWTFWDLHLDMTRI